MLKIIPAVEVINLTVSYNNVPVFSNLFVEIPSGIMLAIIGPNGAGKTTFIKSVLDLIKPVSGTVLIQGRPIEQMRMLLAYIPQRSSIDWDFPITVFDMVLMGCYARLGWFKRPSKQDKADAHEMIATVGLQHMAHYPIHALSGGQQQRAFVARALMQRAHIYFLDEPFAGVDAVTEKIFVDLFKKLRDEGKTIIMVHHDMHTAPDYFDWAMMLSKNHVAIGPVQQMITASNMDSIE